MNKEQKQQYKDLSAALMRQVGEAARAKYGSVEAMAQATGRDGGNLRSTLLGDYSPALDYAIELAGLANLCFCVGDMPALNADTFVQHLLALLIQKYGSQRQAAEACNLSYGYLNKLYAEGKPMIRLAVLCAMANALYVKVTVHHLPDVG
jgi:hypothetical protein